MLIVGSFITEIKVIKYALGTWFNMSNLKQCHFYLGMFVYWDEPQQALFLDQCDHVEQALYNFGIWDAKPVITPMDTNKLELFKEVYMYNAPEKQ